MKELFKAFYSLDESEYSKIWKDAIFVFDTNVLLNLYRYQKSTTEQLIKVIEHLKSRIWIPYHVALEYQRNRLKVIASQNIKFSEVRKIITKGISDIEGQLDNLNLKKRHSTIEPEDFIRNLNVSAKSFLNDLDKLEKGHYNVLSDDSIRDRLDVLLLGKVGTKPADQTHIDKLEKQAEERFKNNIPPGFKDEGKDDSDEPTFTFQSATYQRKYSDFIVWSQIIDFAIKNKLTDLIFITDDNKDDWWLKVKQNGEKTISPRPELISEITTQTSVERFHMYSSEGFLKYANDLLSIGVTSEAIEEVRHVARTRNTERSRMSIIRNIGISSEKAVFQWIIARFGEENVYQIRHEPIDIFVDLNDKKIAFEVKTVRHPRSAIDLVRRSVFEAFYFAEKNDIDELIFVIVTFEKENVFDIKQLIEQRFVDLPPIKILIGFAELDEETGIVSDFNPFNEFEVDRIQSNSSVE